MTPQNMLSYIAEDIRKNDNDRFLCTLLAPENMREDIFTIYAFNQELARVKETTKEEMIGLIRFQWWRETIEEIYTGKVRKHDIAERIAKIINKYALPKNLFLEAIDEREKELQPICFQTSAEFAIYADKTSGNIFRLVAKILGVEINIEPLAKAWVLTGILRATKFNAAFGKILFFQESMGKHNVLAEDILAFKFTEQLKNLVKELHSEAISELKKFKQEKVRDKKNLPISAHAIICETYLKRIKKAGYNLFAGDFEGKKFWMQLKILLASI